MSLGNGGANLDVPSFHAKLASNRSHKPITVNGREGETDGEGALYMDRLLFKVGGQAIDVQG